ncbi:MAG: biotin--[acetyl-CoA-carboxylase] ligase [Candidatus Polarisedimenticolia bacterium]
MTPPADEGGDLTPARLQRLLRSPQFGHRVFYYPSIGSTNDRALELLDGGEAEGAIVLAEEQTRGRGRRDRTWHSPARAGVYVSILLRPALAGGQTPLLTLLAAVAVARALREAGGVEARIKWPNDLVVGRRKIGGILAESRGHASPPREVVVGIGINGNQVPEEFPPEVRPQATSLRIETGRRCDRAAVLASVLEEFERRYTRMLREGPAGTLREWEGLAVAPGGRVVVEGPSGRREGNVAGVDAEGALLLDTAAGRERIAFGEIVRTEWS